MAMPSPSYPQITLFEVSEIHTDGGTIILRNKTKDSVLTINLLSCYGVRAKPYLHEPLPESPQDDNPSGSEKALSSADDEISF